MNPTNNPAHNGSSEGFNNHDFLALVEWTLDQAQNTSDQTADNSTTRPPTTGPSPATTHSITEGISASPTHASNHRTRRGESADLRSTSQLITQTTFFIIPHEYLTETRPQRHRETPAIPSINSPSRATEQNNPSVDLMPFSISVEHLMRPVEQEEGESPTAGSIRNEAPATHRTVDLSRVQPTAPLTTTTRLFDQFNHERQRDRGFDQELGLYDHQVLTSFDQALGSPTPETAQLNQASVDEALTDIPGERVFKPLSVEVGSTGKPFSNSIQWISRPLRSRKWATNQDERANPYF